MAGSGGEGTLGSIRLVHGGCLLASGAGMVGRRIGPSQLTPSMVPLTRLRLADGTQCGTHYNRTLRVIYLACLDPSR